MPERRGKPLKPIQRPNFRDRFGTQAGPPIAGVPRQEAKQPERAMPGPRPSIVPSRAATRPGSSPALKSAKALREKRNDRQLALMAHAIKHPEAIFTIDSHRRSHGVSYQTARTDLRSLSHQKLLTEKKGGRAFEYSPAEDLTARIGKAASRLFGTV